MTLRNRRERIPEGRRLPLNVNLSPEIYHELARIGGGNKSAAVELLVRERLARERAELLQTPTL